MLAISLLNRNGVNDTIQCIDSLLESSFLEFIIYVLDNGSIGGEYKILEEKYGSHKNIVLNKSVSNLGFTGGNNYNIELIRKEKKHRYIMLLNNDCRVEQDFLGDFITKAEQHNGDAIFGSIIKSYSGNIQAVGSYLNLWTGSSKRIMSIDKVEKKVDYVTGSCMLIPMYVIEKTGLLDDRLFAYWEETDYCLRAKKKGFLSYALPVEGVYHKEEIANTRKAKPYYIYLMFRNRLLFLKKHATCLQYIVSRLFLVGYSILIFPKKFGPKNYKHLFLAIRDGVKGKYGKPEVI